MTKQTDIHEKREIHEKRDMNTRPRRNLYLRPKRRIYTTKETNIHDNKRPMYTPKREREREREYIRDRYTRPKRCIVAVCCSVLQCVAVCCSVLQCVYLTASVPSGRIFIDYWHTRHVSRDSGTRTACMLQCVAVCCRVLQRVLSLSRSNSFVGRY